LADYVEKLTFSRDYGVFATHRDGICRSGNRIGGAKPPRSW
jgi:hypothetical protein